MRNSMTYLCVASALLFMGCDSEDDSSKGPTPVADFSFTNDGSTFTFTNLSENAASYRWDFGDLNFYSDEENPVYTYAIGGELTVSLTVFNEDGTEGFIAKKIDAPEIIIINIAIDGDFSDWDDVEYASESTDLTKGSMQKMKIWAAGPDINVLVEGNATMKMELLDLFINTDGDIATGFRQHGPWPDGSGADFLFEGPLVTNAWGTFFEHNNPTGAWGWTQYPGSGANLKASQVVTVSPDRTIVEFSFPKSQFGSVGASIGIAITELTTGYSTVGNFPDGSAYVTLDLK